MTNSKASMSRWVVAGAVGLSAWLSLAGCGGGNMGGGLTGSGGSGGSTGTGAGGTSMPVESPNPPPESSVEARNGLVIFDETRIHDVKLYLSQADWDKILADPSGDDPRAATLTVDGVTIGNISVRPSGESSRVAGNEKISLRVDFDTYEKKKLGGFDSIKLSGSWDDPFVARDRLAYWVYSQFMPSPREVPARLWVNGQPRGVYEIEEIWGKESLKPHFPDDSGTLYRLRGVAGQDPFAYKGDDPALYIPIPWDAKGNHMPEEHLVIGQALAALNATPSRLEEAFDVQNLLTYFAVSAVLSNTDGFLSGFEVDDFFEYHDPTTGKFVMLPWDPDNTFGSINDLPTRPMFDNYDKSTLTLQIRDTALRDRFFTRIEEVMAQLPAEVIQQKADAIADQIRPDVHADNLKMYPTDSFEWSIGYVKDFISARYASLREQIQTMRATPAAGTTTDPGAGAAAGTGP